MMRNMIGVFLVLCFLAFPLMVHAESLGVSDEQFQPVGEALLDNILAGFAENNYQKYARDFDDFLRETIPEKNFLQTAKQIKDTMGVCTSKTYLGFLNKGDMTVGLWKGTFNGTPDDMLIKLVLSQRGDAVVVTGLWFQ